MMPKLRTSMIMVFVRYFLRLDAVIIQEVDYA